jgi:hypothetical protein
MMRALAVVALLTAGCDFTLFGNHGYPDGLTCSDENTCPPNGQQCTGEGICRYICKTANDCLPQNHGGMNTGGTPEICDVDGLCRFTCRIGQTGGCQYEDDINVRGVCDHDGVCRPPCNASQSCGMGFTCDADGACRPQ